MSAVTANTAGPIAKSVRGWSALNLLIATEWREIEFSAIDQNRIPEPFGFTARNQALFLAYHSAVDAAAFARRATMRPRGSYVPANVMLAGVALGGNIARGKLTGAFGYAASEQRIEEVVVPNRCAIGDCDLPTALLGVPQRHELQPYEGRWYLRPLCMLHSRATIIALSPEELSQFTPASFALASE